MLRFLTSFFTIIALSLFLSLSPIAVSSISAAGGVQSQDVDSVEIPLNDKLVLKDGSPVQEVFNSTDDMLNLLVKVLFIGAGMVIFVMIVGAGFAMVQGESSDKEKSKKTLTSALVGLVIMLAAYWIMQILQLITGIYMGF
jgi:hypothetical protein